MKFKIEKEVFDRYPNLIVYIPVIFGFDNTKGREESIKILRESEKILKKKYKDIDELIADIYISSYFDVFRDFGVNPKKVKPTHFALSKRVLEGGNLPDINTIVNIYNALSIKYTTPFGGEDLETVYGDFVLKFSDGNEHWLEISQEKGISPQKGSLIWGDDYDVSTIALNCKQCERTKLRETSKNGYFIMDGFVGVNEENIGTASRELVDLIVKYCGGKSDVLVLSKENPFVEVDFDTKGIEGIELPKVEIQSDNDKKASQNKKEVRYVYEEGTVEKFIQSELAKVLDIEVETINVSQTANNKLGDFTTPVAMQMSAKLRKNPFEIAQDIVTKINTKDEIFSKIEAVKPGFINFFLSNNYLVSKLKSIDENFGVFDEGKGEKIMVEYGQPNTHKSITVGHVKSAITGLSISRLFEALGYEVIQANYFGDLGPYVAKTLYALLKTNGLSNWKNIDQSSVEKCIEYLKNIQKELGYKGVKDEIGKLYRTGNELSSEDQDVAKVIKEINTALFNKSNEVLNNLYIKSREICIEYQTDFFKTLGVNYDRQYPESEVFEIGKQTVLNNIGKVFIKDDGAIIFPGEKYGLNRWVFLTSDGNPTYHGKDLGLVQLKFKEYPDLKFCLIMTSVEQNEYFKALMKVISLINPELDGRYVHEGFGWLLINNKKTSSRGGSFTYDDILSEAITAAKNKIDDLKDYTEALKNEISNGIAIAGIKFNILSHEFHKDINFDPAKFTSLTGYSAPYIMYSYTRAKSVLSKISTTNLDKEIVYKEDEEILLIRKLLEYPNVVKIAARDRKTHILCEYLYELANLFNSFYTTQSILNAEDENIKTSRLLLCEKTSIVIKKGLYLLGIDTIEKM